MELHRVRSEYLLPQRTLLTCNIDKLLANKKYRWDTENKKPETDIMKSTKEQLLRNPDIERQAT